MTKSFPAFRQRRPGQPKLRSAGCSTGRNPKKRAASGRHQLSKLEKGDNDNPQLGLFTTYEEPEPELEPDTPVLDKLDELTRMNSRHGRRWI